jgi:hypothetical protein
VKQLCGAAFWGDRGSSATTRPEDDERSFEALLAINGIPAGLWEPRTVPRLIGAQMGIT